MKRLSRFAPTAALLGFASLALACFSKSDATPVVDSGIPPLPEDSGLSPGQDATVRPDDAGSRTDAADTGPLQDVSVPPLTVTVLSGGAPESGVLVVFQDATGVVLGTETTDAAGTVTRIVAAGSQVTAALGTTQSPNLVTVQDVENGDTLTLVDFPSTNPPYNDEPVTVTLPATTWDAASSSVESYSGACSDPAPFDVYLRPACISQGTFPVLAIATDATGEIAYTYQAGNAVAPDGGPLAVTVSRPWSTSMATETIEASSVPTAADGGETTASVAFDYTEVAGGVPLSLRFASASGDDGGPPGEAFVVHDGYADFTQEDAYLLLTGSSLESEVFAVTRTAPPTASQTTSIALGTLPEFTSASIDADDAGTPSQPVVSWTTAGSLSGANGVITMLQWYGPPPDGGSGNTNGTWTVVSPATATSIQAPSMPLSAAAYTPASTANYNPPRVVAVQASFLAGYSALKAQFATIPVFTPAGNWQPTIPILPANGLTLYVSAIFPNEG